jgi:hypothetical protein
MAVGGKYNKLEHYLAQSKSAVLKLTFSQMEEILGFPLAESAHKYPAFWSNSESQSFALAWLNAGYLSEQVNLTAQTVVFRKASKSPHEKTGKKSHSDLPTMTATTAVHLIQDYFNEIVKDPHGRYKSWEHCYKVFSENRNAVDEQTIDYLALHLAFYLASWGMYRGSSFLLQKDYKVHIPVVKIIQEQKHDALHGISAENLCKDCYLDLLMNLAERVRHCYAEELPSFEGVENHTSDTLVTKILLGTLGCVPAYDRYYKSAVKKNHISSGQFNSRSVRDVAEFYCENLGIFESLRSEIGNRGVEYPPMKLIDMCFWQDAYIDDLKRGE